MSGAVCALIGATATGGGGGGGSPTLTLSPSLATEIGSTASHDFTQPTVTPSGFTPSSWFWAWGTPTGGGSWSITAATDEVPTFSVSGAPVGTCSNTLTLTCNGSVVSNTIQREYTRS